MIVLSLIWDIMDSGLLGRKDILERIIFGSA